ncbi:BQ5605_C002g01574 [Microbotryum silenes-dioicae]|uniref:BQ5605_C002g01574 protein n=1 Tax=Microbotryum silenes-dioicae TaxID=796604 RepID=A0A2X0NWM2_9BASI|nr:BQ5605_C002g01574 [Microbotryum silenes-dioicae]
MDTLNKGKGPAKDPARPSTHLRVPVTQHFAAIEFPGPVRRLDRALEAVGGLKHLSEALLNPSDNTPKNAIELQLNRGPKGVYTHPVPATIVSGGNIVLRLTRRRRKRPLRDAEGNIVEQGIYSIEPLGVASQNIRFRATADFKVQVNQQDPAVQIANAVRAMDIDAILDYRLPEPNENFTDDLFLPPPIFARHTVPLKYEYKPAARTVPTTSIRPSGQEVLRLASSNRYKTKPHTTIPHSSPTVPSEPTPELLQVVGRRTHDALEIKLLAYLERRPVWTRQSLLNQLSEQELRTIQNRKTAIPMVSYSFQDGPFKELVIRFSYDPRQHVEARLYQHIVLRNQLNVRSKAPAAGLSIVPGAASSSLTTSKSKSSHTFDGQNLYSPIANFQLIDISDPLLVELIHSPEAIAETCSADLEGWYKRPYFEQMRLVLKRKFAGLVNGIIVGSEQCRDLLGDPRERFAVSTTTMTTGGAGVGGEEEGGELKGKGKGRRESASAGPSGDDEEDGSTFPTTTIKTKPRAGYRPRVSMGGVSARLPWERNRGKVRAKEKKEPEDQRSARLRKKIGMVEIGMGGRSESPIGMGGRSESPIGMGEGTDEDVDEDAGVDEDEEEQEEEEEEEDEIDEE